MPSGATFIFSRYIHISVDYKYNLDDFFQRRSLNGHAVMGFIHVMTHRFFNVHECKICIIIDPLSLYLSHSLSRSLSLSFKRYRKVKKGGKQSMKSTL